MNCRTQNHEYRLGNVMLNIVNKGNLDHSNYQLTSHNSGHFACHVSYFHLISFPLALHMTCVNFASSFLFIKNYMEQLLMVL